MLFLHRLLILLLTATSAFAATYADVVNDINAADRSIKNATTHVNSFNGAGAQFITIYNDMKQIRAQVQNASTDLDSFPALTSAQCQSIGTLLSTVLNDLKTLLIAFKNKKAIFNANGLKSTIVGILKDLKTAFDTLFDKLIAKCTAQKAAFQTQKNNYDAAFNDAINYLST